MAAPDVQNHQVDVRIRGHVAPAVAAVGAERDFTDEAVAVRWPKIHQRFLVDASTSDPEYRPSGYTRPGCRGAAMALMLELRGPSTSHCFAARISGGKLTLVDLMGAVRASNCYMVSSPLSPVRMRMASARSETKILPSPIWPVWAALRIVLTAFALAVGDDHFDLHLGDEIDGVFGAAVRFVVPFLPAEAADFGDGHALDALAWSAFFTSSSLKWRMIASIFFILPPCR